MVRCVGGRPGRRRERLAQRRRNRSRCQRNTVPGVTIRRTRGRWPCGSNPASNTSHARSAQVSLRARRGSRRCATARAMTQHQNLDVLRRRIPPSQPQPREHPGHDQIDQLQPHDMASSQLAAIVGTLKSIHTRSAAHPSPLFGYTMTGLSAASRAMAIASATSSGSPQSTPDRDDLLDTCGYGERLLQGLTRPPRAPDTGRHSAVAPTSGSIAGCRRRCRPTAPASCRRRWPRRWRPGTGRTARR
jgi:hypothetical protein